MMDSFRFVKCPICGWEKNPRMSCFNCGGKAPATGKTSTDTALAAAEARIAELEKALEPFADWYEQPLGGFDPVTADHCATGIIARVGDLRRAAALLKEKE